MCLLGWMKRGIHARADRRAATRVITPSHSASVCPSSCPNTQTTRLAPYIKDLGLDCSLSVSPAQHRGELCHQPGKQSQWCTNVAVITVETPLRVFTIQGGRLVRFKESNSHSLTRKHTLKTHTVIQQTFNAQGLKTGDLHNESLRKCVNLGEFSIS